MILMISGAFGCVWCFSVFLGVSWAVLRFSVVLGLLI